MGECESNGLDAVDRSVSDLHLDVVNYGTVIQSAINANVGGLGEGYRFSDAAITMMTVDCLAIHGAIRDACAAGWAIVAPMLLRTQMELLLGCTVIINSGERSELLAYKYNFLSTKAILRMPGLPKEKRKRQRDQMDRFMEFLPDCHHAEAREFLQKGKIGTYWYSPDYSGPQDIIERHSNEDVKTLYRAFSGGVHGGSLGIRSWRDIPDLEHPAPRCDPSAQTFAIAGSNAITMQVLRLRFHYRGMPSDPVFDELQARHKQHQLICVELFGKAMQAAKEYVEKREAGDSK